MGKPAAGEPRDKQNREGNQPQDPAKRSTLKKLGALGLLALLEGGMAASCGRRISSALARERKLLIVGLDGLDPRFIQRFMGEGKLPHMARLAQMGGFSHLASSVPPQSPVAWASFISSRDPGGHGLHDFIHRDPKSYLPYLSIARSEEAAKTLSVGDWRLPLSGGKVELLRKGPAFWDYLSEAGVPADIYRVPSNYPPRDTGARQLAGLGAPDLLGTYGTFSYFTEDAKEAARRVSGGAIQKVSAANGIVKTRLVGPANAMREGAPDSVIDFEVWVDRGHNLAKIVIQGEQILLRAGEWSDWVRISFEMMPHLASASAICRFYLKGVSPHLKLYVSPLNIDPADPAQPIAAPEGFAADLAKDFGPFYTQGFPHDVKALRGEVLDDDEYLQQSDIALSEERGMYEAALNRFSRGMLVYYFATTDRTQHMFWRAMDPRHPAYDPGAAAKFGSVIEECYKTADEIIGQAMEAADANTTLVALSDHGFGPYYRSFNLNSWLAQNGYLAGFSQEAEGDIFSRADWRNTLAYGIGFNAVYINLQGREARGSVSAADRERVARHLAEHLQEARDPQTGARVIVKAYLADEVYTARDPDRSPDLIIGYAPGYRCSDESVLGEVTPELAADNTDKWSGDHCIDHLHVPGMIMSNRPLRNEAPALRDMGASALAHFGLEVPAEMNGKSILGE